MTTREELLARTLVELADTLGPEFDVVDLLENLARRSAEIIEATSVCVLLDDPSQGLRLVASSGERADVIRVLQSQATEGPGHDAFSTVEGSDLARWVDALEVARAGNDAILVDHTRTERPITRRA